MTPAIPFFGSRHSPQRKEFVDDMVAALPPDVRPAGRAIIEEMIQRKLTHFAGNARMSFGFDLAETGPDGKPFLTVTSTLSPP